MKSKRSGKGDFRRQFRTRFYANILYSALSACLMELILVINLSHLAEYAHNSQWDNALLALIYDSDLVIIEGYVLLGVVFFTVVFIFLQERSIDYIGKISDAMRSISEGDLNTSVEVEGDDEFSAMAENLNKMAEDIRRLIEKERESERTKNELITNIAHDLRTPLTSVIGYLELLSGKAAPLPDDVKRKYINIAYGKAKHLEKLVEDLFGFTKLNYGKISMHVSKVDIVKLLSQLLEESYPNFEKCRLSYELQSNVAAKVISADGNLLARLFDNLINNAIKYGAEGKRVLVKINAQENIVEVAVENYGYVIPEEELPLIFDKFYRVEHSRSTMTGGTGLGLAIVKNIADLHGGSVSVKSDLEGTVFTVTLQVNFDINKEQFGKLG